MSTIFSFRSGKKNLFAYAGDREGTSLPANHAPWIFRRRILSHQPMPNSLERTVIERAIRDHGYQLWRKKVAES
jgi:hypothetical protein